MEKKRKNKENILNNNLNTNNFLNKNFNKSCKVLPNVKKA